MTELSDLVRMPAGTTRTYLLNFWEVSSFLKKLSTYIARANAKVEHDMWLCVRIKDDTVQRMVVCKVLRPGKKLKRKKRKSSHA